MSSVLFSNKKTSGHNSEETAIGFFYIIKNFKAQEI